MAHEIDSYTDGSASFAFAGPRRNVWHRLGQEIPDDATVMQAAAAARLLGWDVRTEALTVTVEGLAHLVEDRQLVTRIDPELGLRVPLSVMGGTYRPVQPEATAEWTEALVDVFRELADANVETAGALRGGRQLFYCVGLGERVLDPNGVNDRHAKYLTVFDSYDGSYAFSAMRTDVRTVCANTLRFGIGRAASVFKLRHTARIESRLDDARRALGLAAAYDQALDRAYEQLCRTQTTRDTFAGIIGDLWPLDPDAPQATRTTHEQRRDRLTHLAYSSPTTAGWHGTRYGCLQAVSEWNEHIRPVRGGRDARDLAAVLPNGTTATANQKAFDLLTADLNL